MESIYFVLTWLCHRRCRHCYDDRFRPYVRDELQQVVEQSQRNVPRIIDHLPESMMVTAPTGETVKGRIIVSGGEVLLEPVRTSVLYPALEQIDSRYRGGVHLVVQTTGDRLTARILDELLARNVSIVSVSGFDSYHVGINRADRARALREKLLAMFEAAGVREAGNGAPGDDGPPLFNIFGANEDTLDRQAVAARTRLEKRTVACRSGRQLLQCLVRRTELSREGPDGLGGLHRADRECLSLLPQDAPSHRQSRS